jgi:hypothetical protein
VNVKELIEELEKLDKSKKIMICKDGEMTEIDGISYYMRETYMIDTEPV